MSLLTSYFGSGSRKESTMGLHSGKLRPGTGTQVSVFNYRDLCILPAILRRKGVARSPQNKPSKKLRGFFRLRSYFLH